MGFLDDLLGDSDGKLAESIGDMLRGEGGVGGLSGLIGKLDAEGLSSLASSWVGNGDNLPISAEQIEKVLGNEQVAQIAGKLGITPEKAAGQLSQLLPKVVDRITPDGKVPDGDSLRQSLGGLLGK